MLKKLMKSKKMKVKKIFGSNIIATFKGKNRWFYITLSVVFLLITFTYYQSSMGTTQYSSAVLRLSIFYLGSIVTLNIYVYNSTQKLSTVEFLKNNNFPSMIIGIIVSFIVILTIPLEVYFPSIGDWKNFSFSVAVFSDLLSLLNFTLFLLSSAIFLSALFRFLDSFRTEKTIQLNYEKILLLGDLNKITEIEKSDIEFEIELDKNTFDAIAEALEIFNQNLIYLIDLNKIELTKEYIEKWNNLTNYINILIFHIEDPKSKQGDNDSYTPGKENLYNTSLLLTKRLIFYTANNSFLKKENIALIKGYLKNLPVFEEYFKDSAKVFSNYIHNHNKLSIHYYSELHTLLIDLYNSSHKDIYKMLLNGDLPLSDLYNPAHQQMYDTLIKEFKGNGEKVKINLGIFKQKNFVEDMFISILFHIVETHNNSDMSIILALLFKVQKQEEVIDTSIQPGNSIMGNLENLELEDMNSRIKWTEISLNDFTVRFLIIAITKACEVENYKAAGYLVKRLCNHTNWCTINKELNYLNRYLLNGDDLKLSTSKINLNQYSLRYCFQKSVLLLALQSGYNHNFEVPKINFYVSDREQITLIDSLNDRHKDYGLPCISTENLNKLWKEEIEKSHFENLLFNIFQEPVAKYINDFKVKYL